MWSEELATPHNYLGQRNAAHISILSKVTMFDENKRKVKLPLKLSRFWKGVWFLIATGSLGRCYFVLPDLLYGLLKLSFPRLLSLCMVAQLPFQHVHISNLRRLGGKRSWVFVLWWCPETHVICAWLELFKNCASFLTYFTFMLRGVLSVIYTKPGLPVGYRWR